MASQGPNSPGTLANDASVGADSWTNPSNASSSNNNYTTCAMTTDVEGMGFSQYLKATNFGFALPGGATVDGVIVEIEASQNANVSFTTVSLVKTGTIQGDDNGSGSLATPGDAYYSFGSAVTTWGLSLSSADVNASTFGCAISFNTNSVPQTVSIDHIRITVYYTEAGGATSYSVGSMMGVG